MDKITRRGYVPTDEIEFGESGQQKLHQAADELYYLLNRSYSIKSASTLIGNHYLFSERQRLALARVVSSENDINLRKEKQITDFYGVKEVHIDGFNTIITLEVTLSGSPVFKCMDGTIRDLAGLRGTYRIIDKSETAINLIFHFLCKNKIQKAIIYLDAPVSNSGRLKTLISEKSEDFPIDISVEVINEVDRVLEKKPFVVSSDAIILNRCESWINMNQEIITSETCDAWLVHFF